MTFPERLKSRKFWAFMLVTALTAVLMKWGPVPGDQWQYYLLFAVAYIGGQSWVDKTKAQGFADGMKK